MLSLGVAAVFRLTDGCGFFESDVPSKAALGVAESRAKVYWVQHQEQLGRDTRYLAVQSDVIFSDEIPNLYAKLLNSPGVNSSDLEHFGNNNELNMYCVNIFDTRSEKHGA
jgi:hypothetical protein